jgi:hypothetical protein
MNHVRLIKRCRRIRNHLKIAKTTAVIYLDKRKAFGISPGADPSLNFNGSPDRCFLQYFANPHHNPFSGSTISH